MVDLCFNYFYLIDYKILMFNLLFFHAKNN
jgi:hypothetical protein